jgi:hypothetical protein
MGSQRRNGDVVVVRSSRVNTIQDAYARASELLISSRPGRQHAHIKTEKRGRFWLAPAPLGSIATKLMPQPWSFADVE